QCHTFCLQAEDGIRDRNVTGVQTCALPICALSRKLYSLLEEQNVEINYNHSVEDLKQLDNNKWQVTVKKQNTGKTEYHMSDFVRSEERRVGKEWRVRESWN